MTNPTQPIAPVQEYNCPHCFNTGYDASGYPCTCQPDRPMPTEKDHRLDDIVATVIMVLMFVAGWVVFK